MRNPGLKLTLPSEISDTFCKILDEYRINHTSEKKVESGPTFAVNSAQDSVKEIVIELINSGPFWAAFSACFIAYINRSGKKKATIKKDGKIISLENITHDELTRVLEDAKTVELKDGGDKPA
ncbi:hypothetical protein ABW06_23360 [Pluralibacter gergoviae]|uniref:Uncharacterized protein n=2 Tax=Pluralibacter gergoviae TaxID=61647 RepID=A0A0J5KY62_PLUGE|nr:hypothetical protein ABW06_23360 [Pluralibacter gergoviae]